METPMLEQVILWRWENDDIIDVCEGCGERIKDDPTAITLDFWKSQGHWHERCLRQLGARVTGLLDALEPVAGGPRVTAPDED